jgi:hypothetical protein
MDARDAARRWAETWQRAWEALDRPAVEALYAPDADYVSAPFRASEPPTAYLARAFAGESDVRARFGDPIVDDDRAAVQWWATLIEDGRAITLAGTSVLRFDARGVVVSQWDAWDEIEGHREPPAGWATRNTTA